MKRIVLALLAVSVLCGSASAKVDLVTLPERDSVTLTIYNSADLTLVRDRRTLTFKKGINTLQFSWADTLIDPTSLGLSPAAHASRIDVTELSYPPRVSNLGLWKISSEFGGQAPVDITYLTSGLSWRAFYMGTLSRDESSMRLQGYIAVRNSSGEDYDNARVRVVVGKVRLLDRIAELARREYPYGRPLPIARPQVEDEMEAAAKPMKMRAEAAAPPVSPKEIAKEGISEYYLYTIEGTESIPHRWAKRLPSFDADVAPIVNLYKYDEERFGRRVVRFIGFKNDRDHNLGQTSIPAGVVAVYRNVDDEGRQSFQGESRLKYTPVDEKVQLDLGPAGDVIVEPVLMNYREDNHVFDQEGDLAGWDEIRRFKVTVRNTRRLPAAVEITRNFNTPHWTVVSGSEAPEMEKVDLDTIRYRLELEAGRSSRFYYTLTTRRGRRAE